MGKKARVFLRWQGSEQVVLAGVVEVRQLTILR
jgi:hypothetical protein